MVELVSNISFGYKANNIISLRFCEALSALDGFFSFYEGFALGFLETQLRC